MIIKPEDRALDYTPAWDERNRNYSVRPLLESVERRRRYRYWRHDRVLDQGAEGACVGFGWTAELTASPQRVKIHNPTLFAQNVYHEAKKVDEWPGENYEGTSVLAGAKVVQNIGLISEYRWAMTVDEIIDSVLDLGPVVVGIPWYESMYYTRPSALVESPGQPGDRIVGGHCLTITGYSPGRRFVREGLRKYEVFRWVNSWGYSYGHSGRGYIRVDDFAKLFFDYGEACVPVGRILPTTKL